MAKSNKEWQIAWGFKRRCHQLLDQIWGSDKKGRTEAYLWLRSEMGKEIHFADIDDVTTLDAIQAKLMSYKVLVDNQTLVEEVAPAWDAWIDHKRPRGSRRFNRKRNRHLRGDKKI